MSFDFYGGILAIEYLKGLGAEKDLAEAVGEAVIRHQDVGETGSITTIGKLIQIVTLLDNTGANEHLVTPATIESVTAAHPRNNWSSCFATFVREEIAAKPWAHSTHIEEFAEKVEAYNELD
jgi:cyanamide hydratase